MNLGVKKNKLHGTSEVLCASPPILQQILVLFIQIYYTCDWLLIVRSMIKY